MKQKIKKLKIFLALFLAGFLFGCNIEEELVKENGNPQPVGRFVVKQKNYEDLMNDKKIANIVKKLSTKKNLNVDNTNVRKVYSQANNFSINTDYSVYIEDTQTAIYSYTFLVKRTETTISNFTENLVLSFPQEGYIELKLVKYSLTPTEKESLQKGIFVDLTNNVISSTTITDTAFASELSNKIVLVNFINCVRVYNTSCTGIDNHQDGYLTDGTACPGHHEEFLFEVCSDDGGDSGDSGAGDGPVLGSDSSDGGSPSSITTTPVTENLEPFSNICDELAKKDAVQAFKDKLYIELKNKAATQNFESAYMLYNNAVEGLTFSNEFVGDPNDRQGGQVNLDVGGLLTQSTVNCVGFIHCHLDNGLTYKIFSIGDLIALAQIATLSSNSGKEFAIYVITSSGTFAITVNDKLLLKSKLDILKENQSIYEDYFDMKVKKTETVDIQVKGFLDFMRTNSDLGGLGINLNKKNEATGKWEQLTLSSNRKDVLTNSCN